MKKIDVLIPLGSASCWNNHELRYALRSIEENLKNFARIIIIGEKPKFIDYSQIEHHNFKEVFQKEKNIMVKILSACHGDISDNFLFTNDDIFFNKPISAGEIPFYRKKASIKEYLVSCKSPHYHKSLKNTAEALKKNGFKDQHFDVHIPIVYNKESFIKAMNGYDWDVDRGYVIKSLYCNTFMIEGVPTTDLKIDKKLGVNELCDVFNNKTFISVGDNGMTNEMKEALKKRWPKKSRFEI